mgnify:CR=1 FL=1
MDVGLPDGQMGNSEVGHTNIGAGRIVYQELTRITSPFKMAISLKNSAFISAVDNAIAKKDRSAFDWVVVRTAVCTATIPNLYALVELA